MKVALIGYGNMGQRIEALCKEQNIEVSFILDEHNNKNGEGITADKFDYVDIAIDFTLPEVFKINAPKILATNTPMVVGTTGWLEMEDEIRELVDQHQTSLLYGSNFSLGVQLFAKLIERAGALFGSSDLFDAGLHEIHHTQKADAPSGTALTLAELWKEGADSDDTISTDLPKDHPVDEDTFYVTSQRIGSVFGEHELQINSPYDDIVLTHRARSRDAFANGAIQAAKWLLNQKTGYYKIEDVIEELINF